MTLPQTRLPEIKIAPETKAAIDPFTFLDEALENSFELTDEMEDALRELDRKNANQRNRDKRLANCGKWGNWYHQHRGNRTGHYFRCGLHRECANCLEIRANKEFKWVLNTSFDKEMIIIKRPKDNATKVLRDVKKTDYIRFPQEHVDVIIMSKKAAEEKGVKGFAADPAWVKEQDWKEMVKTPQGRNKSGTMHIPPSSKENDKFTIIAIKQFVTDAPRGVSNEIMDAVEVETADLNPKNAKEVKKAIDYRMGLATKRLREAGYSVSLYEKKVKVVESKISWGNNKGLNTGNPTSGTPRNEAIPRIPPETQ